MTTSAGDTESTSSTEVLGKGFSIDTEEFVTQLYTAVPAGVVLIITYCAVRQCWLSTFEVRRKYAQMSRDREQLHSDADHNNNDEDDPFHLDESRYQLPKYSESITFPRISTGWFRWMWDVWTMDASTFYLHAGFDALVFRLYLRGCMLLCLAALPYALLVLLPVYATANTDTSDVLSRLSINNVTSGSGRLYAAVVGCYLFTFLALYYLSRVYLAIAFATDQFLIGSNQLAEIDALSWFNYKAMIDGIVEVNVNVARAPIDFGGNIISQVSEYVSKSQHDLHIDDASAADDSNIDAHDNKQKQHDNNDNDVNIELAADPDHKEEDEQHHRDEEKTELLSDNDYNSDTVRMIEQSVPNIDRYTIMIRDLPKAFQDEVTLKQFLNRLFPNKIAKVTIIPDVRELTQIQKKIEFHSKGLVQLSKKHRFDLKDLYDDAKMPTIYEGTKCCGCCGEEVNLITYHRTNRDAFVAKFNALKDKGLGCTPTAFVTFSCLKAASIAMSCPIRFGISNLSVVKAPYPNDLYWDNLKYSSSDLIPYNLVVSALMFLLLIFWSIPVAAIQALANLETIFEAFDSSVYDYFTEAQVSWIQGSLTVLILDLWLQLIPLIVTLLTKLQHSTHRGRLESKVLLKYFDCLVFMVLLVTVVTGTTVSNASSFSDIAKNLVSSMSTIVNLLADGLSNMSIYFLLYVLLNTFVWLPLELYRPGYHFAVRFGLPDPNRFRYAVWFAKTMLILVIVITYGVMSPLMWILGFVYFVFARFVFTYNLSMSWIPEFETGAKQWPRVFGRIRAGFMISIFTLFGLMALKQAYICAALLIPLALCVWYLTGRLQMRFRPIFNAPSLTSATHKDKQINRIINKNNENGIQQFGDAEQLNVAYLPPIMCIQYPSHQQMVSVRGKKNKKKKKRRMDDEEKEEQNEDEQVVDEDEEDDDRNANEYDSYQNV